MNYLAHIFLSGEEEELMLGNFIADAVKGKQAERYTPGIAKGIRLHRLIDSYTDTHPVVAETKARLRPKYRKFAPVVADMYYDHFLAANFNVYTGLELPAFVQQVYYLIGTRFDQLPFRVQQFFPHMRQHNWLLSYAAIDGIGQALTGMSRRAAFASGMETAAEELQMNYAAYLAEFEAFFPDLVEYVARAKEEL
ncbi:ACP phosphodiesterase [Pontibacter sp. E15-1]|uniref:acyl carrier protein phosphodiesterase n=1 Tax=Pontibacter sp. E15-1 TaxID=2919918 RepID=UPI001F502ED0|nr:ACP phosphodiesterase [Pontibacter sp. E15-1]MCJ8163540.1 ACP phosphodiesterase [Pontibacter sp. E15-1]